MAARTVAAQRMSVDGRAGILDFPCSVQRLPCGNTLIADAGDELGEGSEILEVNPAGEVVWRFGDGLDFAHSAERLADGATLITDTGNHRLLVVAPDGSVRLDSAQWGSLSDGSRLRTLQVAAAASAHLQLYFLDGEGGALTSAPAAPRSTPLRGTVPWCDAGVSARAGGGARGGGAGVRGRRSGTGVRP